MGCQYWCWSRSFLTSLISETSWMGGVNRQTRINGTESCPSWWPQADDKLKNTKSKNSLDNWKAYQIDVLLQYKNEIKKYILCCKIRCDIVSKPKHFRNQRRSLLESIPTCVSRPRLCVMQSWLRCPYQGCHWFKWVETGGISLNNWIRIITGAYSGEYRETTYFVYAFGFAPLAHL